MTGTLYVGTSGFAYGEWKGPFYPPGIRQREMLPFYASRFRSVEINYTFRRQPSETTLEGWRDATPDGFLLALKAHQRITHWLRLGDADESVFTFLERVRLLGPRLGPILFQCPPTLQFDRRLIEAFLSYLPPTYRYAFEFRHPSWEAARDILSSQGAAWCEADTDERPFDRAHLEPRPFVYLRLRKTAYTEVDLVAWCRRIRERLEGGADVFAYFKHEEGGTGVFAAQALVELFSNQARDAEISTSS